MEVISQQDLSQLAGVSGSLCVSVCVPTDPLTADSKVSSLAFKNGVNQALSKLKERYLAHSAEKKLTQVSEELQRDPLFWKEQGKGLILYIADNWSRWYRLPVTVPKVSLIANHLYILPLLAAVTMNYDFFLLELDKEHTALWHGTTNRLRPVVVPDLPSNIEEVTGTEVNERNLQFHTGTAASGGSRRPASFYGSSSWKDDKERYLARFLHAVDTALVAFLGTDTRPLVLSGTEEPVVMFKKIAKVKNLIETDVTKIVELPHKEKHLHESACNILLSINNQQKMAVVTKFEETIPERKLTKLPDILRQGFQGKIDTLLVAENEQVWGTFDTTTMAMVQTLPANQYGSIELLNFAALQTVRTNGQVVVMPKADMPELSTVAAVLRY